MPKTSPLSSKVLSCATLVILSFLVYSNSFHTSFHFDDGPSIVDNLAIRDLSHVRAIFDFWPPRFLSNLSFALDYHWHGLDVWGYHAANLAIHLASGLLVFWLVGLTLHAPAMREQKIVRDPALFSFFVALLFLIHPIQTQAVTYIVQRSALLSAFFYLLSLYCYSASRMSAERGRGTLLYAGCVLSMVCGMFSKESAVTLPITLLLYEIFLIRGSGRAVRERAAPLLLGLLIIPLTIHLTHAMDIVRQKSPADISSGHYLLTQFRVMITYLRLLLIPTGQNLDYDLPIYKNFFQAPVFLSAFFLGLVGFLAFKLYRKHRLLSFSIV